MHFPFLDMTCRAYPDRFTNHIHFLRIGKPQGKNSNKIKCSLFVSDWLSAGVFIFRWPRLPSDAAQVRIIAEFRHSQTGERAVAETTAHAAYSPPAHSTHQANITTKSSRNARFYVQVSRPISTKNNDFFFKKL